MCVCVWGGGGGGGGGEVGGYEVGGRGGEGEVADCDVPCVCVAVQGR